MKKKLEADLISIAHRILKLKNKSELIQLHQETQKLYEKLSVLRFWEENFDAAKPTIGYAELEEKLELVSESQEIIPDYPIIDDKSENSEIEKEETQIPAENNEAPIIIDGKIKPETNNLFKNEIVFDAPEPKIVTQKFTLEDLLNDVSSDPIFERVEKGVSKETEKIEHQEEITPEKEIEFLKVETELVDDEVIEEAEIEEPELVIEDSETNIPVQEPIKTSNGFAKSENKKIISLGLNDRVAFEKHLFAGSSADLNRVISQLITYDTFEEAQEFIEQMVKPDYHNWEGKEEYAMRFMDIVEKKFH